MHLVLEGILVAVVCAASYQLAARYVAAVAQPALLDWELKPAVMLSCGYGFVEPGGVSPERERFLLRKSGSITCEEFAWGGAPTPTIPIAEDNRYSIYGVAWALSLGGTSWNTIDAYLAALFALSMAAIYGVYRLAANRTLALAGVAIVACSTTLAEIVLLRDFVKLPCFALLWFGLAWVIRAGIVSGARTMTLPLAISGLVTGLSIGLRMDALIFVPVFPAVAVVAVPGFTRRDLSIKMLGCVAFVAAFLVTGVPILRSISGGSNSSHVIVLGFMQEFDRGLGIASAPYDIGWHYSDGFAYSVITSYGLLKQGARLPISLGTAEYDTLGNRLIANVARAFPADFMARGLAATAQVFRYPSNRRVREQSAMLPTFQDSPTVRTITRWRVEVLKWLAGRELVVTIAVLVLAAAFNWRLGALGALLTLYFCGYAMLQFSRRHVFHLDVIPIFALMLAAYLPLALARRLGAAFWRSREEGWRVGHLFLRELAIGSAALAVIVLVGSVTLGATRRWQQGHVAELIDRTIASEWNEDATHDEPLASSTVVGEQPHLAWWPRYAEQSDRWKTAVLIRTNGVVPLGQELAAQPDLRQQYFMVVLSDSCAVPEVTLVSAYTAAEHNAYHEYIRSFTIPVAAGAPSRLLLPAYYHLGPNWNRLDGFAVPASERGCVTGVFRAKDPSSLPLPVMAAALAPDWRDRPLYQRVLSKPSMTLGGSAVDD